MFASYGRAFLTICSLGHVLQRLFALGLIWFRVPDVRSRTCLGQVGINCGPLHPEREIGRFVYPEAEGKGYALEAVLAMRDWALQQRRLLTLVNYVDHENIRSFKLAKRLGADLDENAARPHPNDLVFRHVDSSEVF
jgi:RimJ/RimL family protein N-acetyltransferase